MNWGAVVAFLIIKFSSDLMTKRLSSSDRWSIFWLILLYTLQGVPMGMSAVFPLIMKERGATYSDLAILSMCSWPFALKLLWAPIVDGTRLPGYGRRKSWLVPCQLLIGVILYYLSNEYETLVNEHQVWTLTYVFFALYFLAATQDIAVDGWALTMLSESAVGYAGTCNSVGQSAGYFLAFSGFFGVAKLGICQLDTYMRFWAALFIIVTIAVAVLKSEKKDANDSSVLHIYSEMVSVVKLSSVRQLIFILLTSGISFIDGVIGVRFQEAGVSAEVIALLATISTPIQILLPWVISKFCDCTKKPMKNYQQVYIWRIVLQVVSVVTVVVAPMILDDSSGNLWFYSYVFVLSLVSTAAMQIMFTAKMTFFSKVSDPAIGGTYMTVLNTISNIGSNVAQQISYRAVDTIHIPGVDGFLVVAGAALVYGCVWISVFSKSMTRLDTMKIDKWRVVQIKGEF
jgi:MFS transporter, PAT family, solute carrier family 33 (acetyl-CoA transportor), member 1